MRTAGLPPSDAGARGFVVAMLLSMLAFGALWFLATR